MAEVRCPVDTLPRRIQLGFPTGVGTDAGNRGEV
jgi:hypothetical protein